jgi:ferric-dicitrate binding protein FerR (iron transport regulator)
MFKKNRSKVENVPEHLIIRFLEKTILEEEKELLYEWLCEDDGNKEELLRLLEIWDYQDLLSHGDVMRSWEQLCRKIERIEVEKTAISIPVRSQKRKMRWTSYAAAAIVALAFATWFVMRSEDIPEQVVRQMVIIQKNKGVLMHILPDSSVVWLNEESRMTYSQPFVGEKRQVTLEGKAYFEVKKNSAEPFVVEARNIEVLVTGTEFVVNTASSDCTSVVLITGSVEIDAKDEAGQNVSHSRLVPGQQADIDRRNGRIALQPMQTHYHRAWKDGTYRFTDESLHKVAEQLSWHFGVTIHVSPELADKRLTGRVTPQHSVKDVLENIRTLHTVKYSVRQNEIFITKK